MYKSGQILRMTSRLFITFDKFTEKALFKLKHNGLGKFTLKLWAFLI